MTLFIALHSFHITPLSEDQRSMDLQIELSSNYDQTLSYSQQYQGTYCEQFPLNKVINSSLHGKKFMVQIREIRKSNSVQEVYRESLDTIQIDPKQFCEEIGYEGTHPVCKKRGRLIVKTNKKHTLFSGEFVFLAWYQKFTLIKNCQERIIKKCFSSKFETQTFVDESGRLYRSNVVGQSILTKKQMNNSSTKSLISQEEQEVKEWSFFNNCCGPSQRDGSCSEVQFQVKVRSLTVNDQFDPFLRKLPKFYACQCPSNNLFTILDHGKRTKKLKLFEKKLQQ